MWAGLIYGGVKLYQNDTVRAAAKVALGIVQPG